MWRCELISAGSERTEWRIFQKIAVILWLYKVGALLEHLSGRSCGRRLAIMRMVLTCGAIWGALEVCIRVVHGC
jgi:hypothetical protein